ncbi:MAG: diguanylate cyclase domain-containing protein [Prochlorothrix sp.]
MSPGSHTFQSDLIPEYTEQGDEPRAVEYVLAITRDVTAEKQMESQLRLAVEQDGLTQVANRRMFNQYLEEQWLQALQSQTPLALILCDVDFFKLYNDTYGHLAGDECLHRVAQALARCVRRSQDLVARYGGEEFGLILPNMDLKEASDLADRLRTTILNCQIPHQSSPISPYLTLSLGCVSGIPQINLQSADLITQTDLCLYQAKRWGRNQVSMAQLASA